jgi:hypothetical protein
VAGGRRGWVSNTIRRRGAPPGWPTGRRGPVPPGRSPDAPWPERGGRSCPASADSVGAANAIGLPRYAKQAVDAQFTRWIMLHVQANPLPI